ncbi:MAG: 1-deoxy-D-xylulose-5-phosphate reductoisomerase [Cyanobacteria bacterium NC_groundwater_1444_Ag_S-0.65um_54_12]|nr:1-deoxy-D-xylulose-5-phosphate reductoisomerase [Cyanobacteria bacterium NC_groundwater_1444_Ag_S-0.65um_54_12]
MIKLAILGATGSVGRQALEVVRAHPERLKVVSLVAGHNLALLEEQWEEFQPLSLAVADSNSAARLQSRPAAKLGGKGCHILYGSQAISQIAAATEVDMVLVALSGILGLAPTLAAIRAGKKVAFANKETLVAAGPLVLEALRAEPAAILCPVDSEHSALWQAMWGERASTVRRIVITASGGALRDMPLAAIDQAAVSAVLAHPTWPEMGRKITVDSATLMNKALEVIEAHYLFGIPYDAISVVLHPQSAVHGLVEFVDGSIKAQVGPPDMRIPLQIALLYPERQPAPWEKLELANWTFAPIDPERYPALELGYQAGRLGGTAPAVLNAANEIAVERFLGGEIAFGEIVSLVRDVLFSHTPGSADTLEEVLAADAWARMAAGSK